MKYLTEQKGRLVEIVFNDSDSSSDTLFSKVRKGEIIDPFETVPCGGMKIIKADDRSRSAINKDKRLRNELARRIQKFEYPRYKPKYVIVSELEIFRADHVVLYHVTVRGVKLRE